MAKTWDFTGALTNFAVIPSAAVSGAGVTVTGIDAVTTGTPTPGPMPPFYKLIDPSLHTEIVGTTSGADPKNYAADQWLTVRLSADSGSWAGVYFTSYLESKHAFPIRGDGVMRTYNVWLGAQYTIPRLQLDTQRTSDPSGGAVTSGDLVTNTALARTSARLYIQNAEATVDTTSGSANLAIAVDNDEIVTGMAIGGAGIPVGATVVSYNKTTNIIVMSVAATATATGVEATFQYPITVYPTTASDGTGTVEFIKLQPQPEGPVNLVITKCCPAQALLRTNQTTIWGIRVHNAGGIKATGIQLSFSPVSTGLTVSAANTVFEDIPPDEDRTFFFEVVSTTAFSFRSMDVTVTCDQGDSVTYTGARGWYYGNKPTGLTTIPLPVTVPLKPSTTPLIGVWAFLGWNQWYPTIGHTFENRPLLGYASLEDPQFWRWQIKLHAEHGVDYFMMQWVERINIDADTTFCEPIIINGLIPAMETAGFVGKMKFEINYINGGDAVAIPRDELSTAFTFTSFEALPTVDLGSDNDYHLNTSTNRLYGPKAGGVWDTSSYVTVPAGTTREQCYYTVNFLDMFRRQSRFFTHPDYLKEADGRVRYSFFGIWTGFYCQVTSNIVGDVTIARTTAKDLWVTTLLERANQMAIDAGATAGVSWGAGQTGTKYGRAVDAPADNGAFWAARGFNRCGPYNAFAQGSPANIMDYDNHRRRSVTFWDEHHNITHGIKPQVLLNAGFDSSRWKPEKRNPPWIIPDFTVEGFRAHIDDAIAWRIAKGFADDEWEILINSSFEWGEGSFIDPVAQHGFKMLQAIREKFYPAVAIPVIYGPTDLIAGDPSGPIANMAVPTMFRWNSTRSAFMVQDNNTNLKEGIQIPDGSYPAIEGVPCYRTVTRNT